MRHDALGGSRGQMSTVSLSVLPCSHYRNHELRLLIDVKRSATGCDSTSLSMVLLFIALISSPALVRRQTLCHNCGNPLKFVLFFAGGFEGFSHLLSQRGVMSQYGKLHDRS